MGFRNLPTGAAAPLASLVEARAGQVSSRTLTRIGDPLAAALLSFAEGESVSEERYPGGTLYYLVEGAATINGCELVAGDVLLVEKDVEHAVLPKGPCKLLQLTLATDGVSQ